MRCAMRPNSVRMAVATTSATASPDVMAVPASTMLRWCAGESLVASSMSAVRVCGIDSPVSVALSTLTSNASIGDNRREPDRPR